MDSKEEQNFISPQLNKDLEALETGITTRVLAERIRSSTQALSSSERRESVRSGGRRSSSIDKGSRKPSRFLTGTTIPNSVIQSNLHIKEPPQKDEQTIRRERDEHVSQIVEKFLPKHRRQLYDEATDLEALAKIRKELQKRSSVIEAESNKENQSIEAIQKEMPTKTDSKETVRREKRRVSCRTEIFMPLGCRKAPTLDSVRRAVENANVKVSRALINADELLPTPRRETSSETVEPTDLISRHPSSFITRRKFVSKLEKSRGKPSLEVLQPGINRPSVKESRSSRDEQIDV